MTDVVFVQLGNTDAHVGHTTIHVSQTSTQLCHLVHLVYALASEEVQTVKILFVLREEQLLLGLLDADDGLEDGTLAILNPLTHRVQVGSEINACGEDALLVLTL